jgi:hypothetical protein
MTYPLTRALSSLFIFLLVSNFHAGVIPHECFRTVALPLFVWQFDRLVDPAKIIGKTETRS